MYLLVAPFLLLSTIAYAQIPSIRAVGGDGTLVNWPQLKQSEDPEGTYITNGFINRSY